MEKTVFQTLVLVLTGAIFFIIISGFGLLYQKDWPVPDNYKKMKNPVATDAVSVAEGKTLYATHCKSCHGAKGLGDGNKAAQLKTEPGNFATAEFHSQSDGSLFYKTTEGRDDMPNFKKKMPDADERWAIVNFMRTLKK